MDAIGPRATFTQRLAKLWPNFVRCDERLLTEGPFLLRVISEYRTGIVLDAAVGMGCESLFLVENGFQVISNEIDCDLLHVAQRLARRKGIVLNTTSYNWRDIDRSIPVDSIDAIVLLGNSLCLLGNTRDVEDCLKRFYRVMRPGGCLIVDERNFPYILVERDAILNGRFRYSGRYMYCGTVVTGRPIAITADNVRFGYFYNCKELIGTLDMYPFKAGELVQLLKNINFRDIKLYSDFREGANSQADFFTYVAFKR